MPDGAPVGGNGVLGTSRVTSRSRLSEQREPSAAASDLLPREAQPASLPVDVRDDHRDLIAGLYDVFQSRPGRRTELAHMDQPFDPVRDLDEDAERDQLGHPPAK
jgi:hypothetical protein